MFNILLDELPTEYEGFPIDSDFQIGIQIMQVLEDEELTQQEQMRTALSLLYISKDKKGNPMPLPDVQTAVDGVMWFLFGWNHDNNLREGGEKVTDWYIDQWRIYSAFRQQYGINLNDLGAECIGYKIYKTKLTPIYRENRMHFWEFMALLTTLQECAYTRVADIRDKKITGKMGKEERETYERLKRIYALKQSKTVEYTDEQKQAIDEYDRMIEEQKKIKEGKKLAQKAFEDMI